MFRALGDCSPSLFPLSLCNYYLTNSNSQNSYAQCIESILIHFPEFLPYQKLIYKLISTSSFMSTVHAHKIHKLKPVTQILILLVSYPLSSRECIRRPRRRLIFQVIFLNVPSKGPDGWTNIIYQNKDVKIEYKCYNPFTDCRRTRQFRYH